MNAKKEPVLKVLILGNCSVGKTSLLSRYVDDFFTSKYRATIGADFKTKRIIINEVPTTLQIWDTAGQERFQSLGQAFYRGADACLLVFDITSGDSFEALESWKDEFMVQTNMKNTAAFPFAVVGNKCDLKNRQVAAGRVKKWCQQSRMMYLETSAKDATNVSKLFQGIASKAVAFNARKSPVSIPTGQKLKPLNHTAKSPCPCQ